MCSHNVSISDGGIYLRQLCVSMCYSSKRDNGLGWMMFSISSTVKYSMISLYSFKVEDRVILSCSPVGRKQIRVVIMIFSLGSLIKELKLLSEQVMVLRVAVSICTYWQCISLSHSTKSGMMDAKKSTSVYIIFGLVYELSGSFEFGTSGLSLSISFSTIFAL